jgi:hypothetical protein
MNHYHNSPTAHYEETRSQELNDFDFGNIERGSELESHYWVDDYRLSRAFGSILPARLADLIDLAMSVYYADRRAHRVRSPFELTGHRDIRIHLPLRDPDIWKSSEVNANLAELLSWFTEDNWDFEFTKLGVHRKSEFEESLFASPVAYPNISLLFSGGLDSLAGLCTLMDKNRDFSFILVSGCTSRLTARIQRDLIREIVRYWQNQSREVRSVVIPFGIRKPGGTVREETSQRSRGFVFLLVGAVAAIMAKSNVLYVCENGIGSVNLPFNEGQLGVDNTRGVHPISLIGMSEFLGLVLEQPITIVNPFEFSTKAEMCRAIKKLGLDSLIKMTVSCDGFPLRIHDSPSQCGICTSCLIRRCSLHAAELAIADPSTCYRFDIKNSFVGLSEWQLYPLMAVLDQVDKIRTCIASPLPWEAMIESFPELIEIQHKLSECRHVSLNDIAESYIRMYRTYVEEWGVFPVNVR